jgi:hypothetical protein
MILCCVAAFYSCSRCLVLGLLAGYKSKSKSRGHVHSALRVSRARHVERSPVRVYIRTTFFIPTKGNKHVVHQVV